MPDPIDTQVGLRLRLFRKSQGVTQTALAEQIGVTFQQIQKYESGKNRISPSRLQMVSRALNTPVERFFDEDTERLQRSVSPKLQPKEVVDLAKAYLRIRDPRRKTAVMGLIEILADQV